MEMKQKQVISLRHYSSVNPYKCMVQSVDETAVRLRLAREHVANNFQITDPVVVGYDNEDKIVVAGGGVCAVSESQNSVDVIIDDVAPEAMQRLHERFAVSLYADVRIPGTKARETAIVKDISFYGLKLFFKKEANYNQVIEIDIYLDKMMIFLKAKIVRKVNLQQKYEYGLNIVYDNIGAIKNMKEYLSRLKYEQEEFVKHLRNVYNNI